MYVFKIKDNIQIISYKHDKSLHRVWDTGMLIDADKGYLVIANEKTQVLESTGKIWFTKEPAICFFYKKYWFNIIAMLKKDGIHYYCNIGSPYVLDEEGIKYIDYDLDLKEFPNKKYRILDRYEFKKHSEEMNYSKDLIKVLESELDTLIEMVKEEKDPFNDECVMRYYNLYRKYQQEESN